MGPRRLHSRETYPGGQLKASWSGCLDASGRYLLDGGERWYYPSGRLQYEVRWLAGRKIGLERHWDEQGKLLWQWEHRVGGDSVWTHFRPHVSPRLQSSWRNRRATGTATEWDADGRLVRRMEFVERVNKNWTRARSASLER
ncbi:MAG: toxin-antitoxin system YwqK family antitoxin [Bryobacteraceae bacterium]